MARDHAAVARAEVSGRLASYRKARSTLHADIRRAAELGMTTTEIARECGMTWHGVAKILKREGGDE